jgi:hypothetical protein
MARHKFKKAIFQPAEVHLVAPSAGTGHRMSLFRHFYSHKIQLGAIMAKMLSTVLRVGKALLNWVLYILRSGMFPVLIKALIFVGLLIWSGTAS